MNTVTFSELRTRYASVVKWIEAGQEVKISKDGKVIARFVPEKAKGKSKVKRSTRARAGLGKATLPMITAEQKAALFDE